jgi:heterodisulfide reductase subunit D
MQVRRKKFYDIPLKTDQPVDARLAMDCYLVFACRHKFCREVCPVYQETGNESHTSYGFHTSVLALSRDLGKLSDLGQTFTYCLECGACELRCPNTLFAGDFYKVSTTTVDLVRKVRSDLVREGRRFGGLEDVQKEVETHLSHVAGPREDYTKWADDLDIGRTGETMLLISCFQARQTTEIPRAIVKLLKAARVEFGILDRGWCSTEEGFDVGKEDLVKEHARKNIEALERAGARTVVIADPHDYFLFQVDYPRWFGKLPFDMIFVTDYLWRLVQLGQLKLTHEVRVNATYHDPCTLNKLTGLWESSRNLIKAVPGITFTDEDHVSQWSYCCGNGVNGLSFRKLHPEISSRIGAKRIKRATDLGCDTLLLACPHCKDNLTEVAKKSKIKMEFLDVVELLAKAGGVG